MILELSQFLGWTATFLFSVMLIPQIIKTIKTKDARGVSIILFIVYLIANIIALVYAILIDQNPLKIKYSLGIFTSVFYIGVFVYYKNQCKKREDNFNGYT